LIVQRIYFSEFSLSQTQLFNQRMVMNQGEILNYMNIHKAQITKYDIKRIILKHKLEVKAYRHLGTLKNGYELFKEFEFSQNEAPF